MWFFPFVLFFLFSSVLFYLQANIILGWPWARVCACVCNAVQKQWQSKPSCWVCQTKKISLNCELTASPYRSSFVCSVSPLLPFSFLIIILSFLLTRLPRWLSSPQFCTCFCYLISCHCCSPFFFVCLLLVDYFSSFQPSPSSFFLNHQLCPLFSSIYLFSLVFKRTNLWFALTRSSIFCWLRQKLVLVRGLRWLLC